MIGEVKIDDQIVLRAFERAPAVMLKRMDRAVGLAGLTLARAVRKELRDNESMGQSTLLNSIRADRPFPGARDVRAGVKYARRVEDGTKPGYMPPLQPLMDWISAKEGSGAGNLRQRAYGMAKHIRLHGTQPHPFFKPAFDKSHSRLLQILRTGAAEGVREVMGLSGFSGITGF